MSTKDKVTSKGDPNIAEIGDNGHDEAVAFDAAMREQIKLNAERSALNAKISTARKGFKANGIELKHLDATIHMMEWSPSEIREHFDVQHRYARYCNLPVGAQLDLLSQADDNEVSAQDWHFRGYAAATTGIGKPGVPPPECPQDRHQDWLSGWNDGQVVNAPKSMN